MNRDLEFGRVAFKCIYIYDISDETFNRNYLENEVKKGKCKYCRN